MLNSTINRNADKGEEMATLSFRFQGWFNFLMLKAGSEDRTDLFAPQFHNKYGTTLYSHQRRKNGRVKGYKGVIIFNGPRSR